MKLFLLTGLLFITGLASAQDEFHLEYNEDSLVQYQGVVENEGVDKAALFTKGVAWMENREKKYSITFQDPEVGKIVGKAEFTTVGKKSAYGKAYYYTFSCVLTLDFKDGKTRYTLNEFKKKSSPGEPGSTIEYFINNYAPVIKSQKSRDREAKMLDQIEIDIQAQIDALMDDIILNFGPEKNENDW